MPVADMIIAEFAILEKTWKSWGVRNFTPGEFFCKCGCGWANMDHALLVALQELRDSIGRPITITRNGGCRCAIWNPQVGGSDLSQHMWARGADIYSRGISQKDLKAAAEEIEAFNISGIGLGRTRIHVDVRGVYGGKRTRWTY